MTPEHEQRLAEVLATGASHREAAEVVGVSKAAVTRYVRRRGAAPKPDVRPEATPAEVRQARKDRHRAAALRKLSAEQSDELEAAHRRVELLEQVLAKAPLAPPQVERKSVGPVMDAPHSLVQLISDVHYGEVVSPEAMGGLNEYNPGIAKARLSRVFHVLQKRVETDSPQAVYLPLLGDMVSGSIHEELMETNQGTTIEHALELGEFLGEKILDLAQICPRLVVPCIVGNHGRTSRRFKAKTGPRDSYDWAVYQTARRVSANAGAEWHIPAANEIVLEIHGLRLAFIHGHGVRGGNAISGIHSALSLAYMRRALSSIAEGRNVHHLCLGHFHGLESTSLYTVNGTPKGHDEYAALSLFRYRVPEQALLGIAEGHGIWKVERVRCDSVIGREKVSYDGGG